jgi:predicted nucleic acid-binding protein
LKDAPIVAAAKKAQADMLVTLDKKHLLGKPELAMYAGMKIVTPKEAIEFLPGG